MDVSRLLDAYRRGIFPWSSEGQPMLWWSPDPRMVLFTDEFALSRSLRRRLRDNRFDVRIDTACDRRDRGVRRAAGRAGGNVDHARNPKRLRGTASAAATSIRSNPGARASSWAACTAWRSGGSSSANRCSRTKPDASKVALVHLVARLRALDVPLIDCQQETAHLASLGARPIPRARFAALLSELIHSAGPPAGWQTGRPAGVAST